jgi:hypothetical protein
VLRHLQIYVAFAPGSDESQMVHQVQLVEVSPRMIYYVASSAKGCLDYRWYPFRVRLVWRLERQVQVETHPLEEGQAPYQSTVALG